MSEEQRQLTHSYGKRNEDEEIERPWTVGDPNQMGLAKYGSVDLD